MARLPIPGGDVDEWGSILNSYLQISHNTDGTLVQEAVSQAGAVTSVNGRAPASGDITLTADDLDDITTTAPVDGQVLTYSAATGKWRNQTPATSPVTSVVGQTGAITGTQIAADTALTGTFAQLAGATFTGHVSPAAVTLVFGSSIAVNAALGNIFNLTLTSSSGTLANPTNPLEGQILRLRIIQGAGAPYSLAYDTAYAFGAAGKPVLSATAGSVDIVAFEYVASKSAWCYIGAGLGF